MDEYIGSRGRTRLRTVPYLAGEDEVPARWYAEMGTLSLSQTVVELQRHFEVAASEF
jgi:hypothetical protein